MAKKKNDNPGVSPTETAPLAPVIPIEGNEAKVEQSQANTKVGDWVYYAFDLHQVKEMRGSDIVELSDGNTKITAKEGTSLNADTLTLSPQNKLVTELFKKIWEEFAGYSAVARLNARELYPWLVNKWIAMSRADKTGQEAVLADVDRLRKSVVGVIQQLHQVKFSVETPSENEEKNKTAPAFQLFA